MRKTPETQTVDKSCANSHRPKWDPLPPSNVGSIVQHIKEREGRKEGKDRWGPENKKVFDWQNKGQCVFVVIKDFPKTEHWLRNRIDVHPR